MLCAVAMGMKLDPRMSFAMGMKSDPRMNKDHTMETRRQLAK
jgi:hypothetical protein